MPPRPMAHPRTGIALSLACLLLLGLMPVLANGRPMDSGALAFAFWLSLWQMLFAVPLQAIEWRSGERGALAPGRTRSQKRRALTVTLFTGTLFGLSTWLYVLAMEKVGVTSASLALQAYPLFAAGLEAVWLGKRKSAAELGFTLLILSALYYLATGGTWLVGGLSPWFLVALAVPALWTVAHVILRQSLLNTPITPTQVTTSRLAVSTLVLLPLALAIDGPDAVLNAGRSGWVQVFAVTMGLAYYLELLIWFNAVRHIEVSLASAITVPAPAVTMILAVLFLGEIVEPWQVAAFCVIAAGLFGLLWASERAQARAARLATIP